MSFEKLLGELEEFQSMQKSEPANDNEKVGDDDDKKIAEAAEENDENHAEADDENGSEEATDDESMGKSYSFQLDSGETIDAVDGTELVKSLMTKIDGQEASMTKAMAVTLDLIKSQGEQISALKTEVTRLGSEGRGRKTVVSVAEKPAAGTMQKSEPVGLSGEEFMTKALAAQAAGRITALEVSIAEGSLLKGLPVRGDIINKVIS